MPTLHHHMHVFSLTNLRQNFLKMQQLQPLVWFRYTDDIFLHGRIVKVNLMNLS